LGNSRVLRGKRQTAVRTNQNGGVKVNWSLDCSLISRFPFRDSTRFSANVFDRVHLPSLVIPPEAKAFLLAVQVVARRFLLPILMPTGPRSYRGAVVVHALPRFLAVLVPIDSAAFSLSIAIVLH